MGLVDFRGKMTSLRSSADIQCAPRKKRTFDIAFLTGQSENSSEGTVSSIVTSKKSTSLQAIRDETGDGGYEENDLSGGGEEGRTFDSRTLSEMTTRSSSTASSSIDIMTNGSFVTSDSESQDLSPGGDEPETRKGKSHKYRQSANNNNRPELKSFLEEIRSDSKKPIEINHPSSSPSHGSGRNGKDNLQQFSGILPPGQPQHHHHPLSPYSDFRLPHLASTFVFLPQMQMAKFPIHYPGALKAGADFHASKSRGGFPTEQQYIAAATAASYPYNYPNFMLQESPRRQDQHRPQTSQGQSQQQLSQSGGGGQIRIGSPTGGVATLLPPSLTALSLPAQNVCAKCNIGFRMTSDLVYHMRSHHKRETDPMKKKREDKLKCPVCSENFRERHHLTRHMTAHQDRAEEVELDASKVTLL